MSSNRGSVTERQDRTTISGNRRTTMLVLSVVSALLFCIIVAVVGILLMPNRGWIYDGEFSKQFWSGLAGNYFSSIVSGVITGLVVGIIVWNIEQRSNERRDYELNLLQSRQADSEFQRDFSLLLSDLLIEIFLTDDYGATKAVDSCNQSAHRVAIISSKYPLEIWIESGRDKSNLFRELKKIQDAYLSFLMRASVVDEKIAIAVRTVHQESGIDKSKDDLAHRFVVGRILAIEESEIITRMGTSKDSLSWLRDDAKYVESVLSENDRQGFIESRTLLDALMKSLMKREEILRAGAHIHQDDSPPDAHE